MCTTAVTAHFAQSGDSASLVLEAERVALSDIENFRRKALLLIVTSGLRAALVHQRAVARIKRLRERMRADAQAWHVRICCETEALAGDIVDDALLLAALDIAIVRVSEEIAGISESS